MSGGDSGLVLTGDGVFGGFGIGLELARPSGRRLRLVFGLRMWFAVWLGVPSSLQLGRGFTGQIAESGEPGILPDITTSRGLLNPVLRNYAKALWGMPLKANDRVVWLET